MGKYHVHTTKIALLLCSILLMLIKCSDAPIPDVWEYDKVEVKPKPIYIPEPVYPFAAQVLGIEGTVVTRCVVDIDSTIALVEMLQSSGYSILDNAAVDAAYQALFEPAMTDGQLIVVWVSIPFCFSLEDD